MHKHLKILAIITEIRNSHSEMANIFQEGSCLNFYCILSKIFPEAVAYYNVDHIITRIDNKYYDITGEVDSAGYEKFTDIYPKKGLDRAYTQMYNAEYIIK